MYASSEMVAHASLSREFRDPFLDRSPGKLRLEDSGSRSTPLRAKKPIAEE